MKTLIVIAVIVALVLFALALIWAVSRGGVRRKEFEQVRAERNLAVAALDGIEEKVSTYNDLESPLASAVRAVIHDSRTKRAAVYNRK